MLNKNLFAQTMTMLFELYEKQQTKPLMDIYYSVLCEMKDAEFQHGVMDLIKTRVYPTMPKPAEIYQYKPQEKIIAIEDEATRKAKELISWCESANSVIYDNATKSGRTFEDELKGTKFVSLSDGDIAILNQVKPYTDHKQLIINIRAYRTSQEALNAFKRAVEYSSSYAGAIENATVRKMIKGK